MEFLIAMGIPTAITGLLVWWLKRHIDQRDKNAERRAEKERKQAEDREKNTERLMLMIMHTSRATNVLAEATARAVQRIPDAHCNGDMTAALARAAALHKEEEDFFMDQSVQHIFGE